MRVYNQYDESTHPVYAALDHPLFGFAGKRVKKRIPIYARSGERGDKCSDVGVSRKTLIFYAELTLS